MTRTLWDAVDGLIDRAPDTAALRAHRLDILAARRWRALGRSSEPELDDAERFAAVVTLTAPRLLDRVRSAYDGPLLLVKGPEVAARYPDPVLRSFRDLDVLVPDASGVQQELLGAGFEEGGDAESYAEAPHDRPLYLPGFPLLLEVHRTPNWPRGTRAPRFDELADGAIPSRAVEGVLVPAPAKHVLVLAAHAWMHGPIEKIRDLLDVAVMAAEVDRDDVEAIAADWGALRLWRSTLALVDSLFYGARRPPALRLWAQNLPEVRERTVLESHVGRWLAGFSTLPPRPALRALTRAAAADVRPERGEPWSRKLGRSRRALANALARKSAHDSVVGRRAADRVDPGAGDG